MTLITRLITKERVIFLTDGWVTQPGKKEPLIVDAPKLIKHKNVIIGVSGTVEYGEYHSKRNIVNTISEFINEFDNYNSKLQDELIHYLMGVIEEKYNGHKIGVCLLISYIEDKIIKNFSVTLSSSKIFGFQWSVEEIQVLENQFNWDINFRNRYPKFIELINKTSFQILNSEMTSNLINNMSSEEIDSFGNKLYESFENANRLETVGPFFMKEVLTINEFD